MATLWRANLMRPVRWMIMSENSPPQMSPTTPAASGRLAKKPISARV